MIKLIAIGVAIIVAVFAYACCRAAGMADRYWEDDE